MWDKHAWNDVYNLKGKLELHIMFEVVTCKVLFILNSFLNHVWIIWASKTTKIIKLQRNAPHELLKHVYFVFILVKREDGKNFFMVPPILPLCFNFFFYLLFPTRFGHLLTFKISTLKIKAFSYFPNATFYSLPPCVESLFPWIWRRCEVLWLLIKT